MTLSAFFGAQLVVRRLAKDLDTAHADVLVTVVSEPDAKPFPARGQESRRDLGCGRNR